MKWWQSQRRGQQSRGSGGVGETLVKTEAVSPQNHRDGAKNNATDGREAGDGDNEGCGGFGRSAEPPRPWRRSAEAAAASVNKN
jgi:hypothetical protein